jgi:4-hydroxybenzoyl-CoA reductase gamma subunit
MECEMAKRLLSVTVNGRVREDAVSDHALLVDYLRDDAGLTGTKEGCGEGECGACTVLVDGEPVCACLVPFAQVSGAEVLTIEGLGGEHPLQRAFAALGGAQCGICTPGMIMSAEALLRRNPAPSEREIRDALGGNVCRCTGYVKIVESVQCACAAPVED